MKGVSTMWKWLKETILAIVVVVLTTAPIYSRRQNRLK